jgi:hypothetical protein
MKDGQVFIKNAVIPKVQLSRTETDPRKGYASVLASVQKLRPVLSYPQKWKKRFQMLFCGTEKNLQPGGTIWNSLKSGF